MFDVGLLASGTRTDAHNILAAHLDGKEFDHLSGGEGAATGEDAATRVDFNEMYKATGTVAERRKAKGITVGKKEKTFKFTKKSQMQRRIEENQKKKKRKSKSVTPMQPMQTHA